MKLLSLMTWKYFDTFFTVNKSLKKCWIFSVSRIHFKIKTKRRWHKIIYYFVWNWVKSGEVFVFKLWVLGSVGRSRIWNNLAAAQPGTLSTLQPECVALATEVLVQASQKDYVLLVRGLTSHHNHAGLVMTSVCFNSLCHRVDCWTNHNHWVANIQSKIKTIKDSERFEKELYICYM